MGQQLGLMSLFLYFPNKFDFNRYLIIPSSQNVVDIVYCAIGDKNLIC